MSGGLLTPAEAAKALRVSDVTMYQWLRAGTVPGRKVGKLWYIPRRWLEDLEAGDNGASPEPGRASGAGLRALKGGKV